MALLLLAKDTATNSVERRSECAFRETRSRGIEDLELREKVALLLFLHFQSYHKINEQKRIYICYIGYICICTVCHITTRNDIIMNSEVIKEGDPGDAFFIIRSGDAAVVVGGRQVALLKEGGLEYITF